MLSVFNVNFSKLCFYPIAKFVVLCYFDFNLSFYDKISEYDKGDSMERSGGNALSEIYRRYYKVMLYVANRILGSPPLSEDAVQNAFTKILKHPEHILSIPIDELKPYLIVVSENSARTLYRKTKKIEEASLDDVPLFSSGPEDQVVSKLSISDVFNMPAFNPIYRDIIILKYYYDLDDKTIAQTLGISQVNVRVRLSRAKSQLRRLLDSQDGGIFDERPGA